MTAFPTCHTCAFPSATCATRDALRSAIAGLGITSVKHRCRDFQPAFMPGDAVKVETVAWFHSDDDDPPPKLWFPGHFVRLTGRRALVYVPEGAEDLNAEEVKFEPNGTGFLKVPLARVAHRDAPSVDVTECRWCGAIPALGNPCGRDPNYTPSGQCLAALQQAQASAEQGDREGHGTERPQASPQPRDEPLPSPDNTNPKAGAPEHG